MPRIRVVLVGSPGRRSRLRDRLGETIEVVGEAETLRGARSIRAGADAYLLAEPGWEDDPPLEALTARESEVLQRLADGLPNKAIARELGLSEETVKFHLSSIFGKLGASNRTDAVRQAIRRGLVPL